MRHTPDSPDVMRALQLSPVPYAVLDREFRFVDVNPAFQQIVFQSRESLINHNLFEVFDDEEVSDLKLLKHSLDMVLKTGIPHSIPVIIFPFSTESRDGLHHTRNRCLSLTHTPITNNQGRVVQILQQIQDVSEVVRLRASNAGLQQTLPEHEQTSSQRLQVDNLRLASERSQLMDMFVQAPGFVAILYGEDHRILMLNSACAELLGHRDVLCKAFADVLPELVRQGYKDAMDAVYRTGVPYQARQTAVFFENPSSGLLEEHYLDFMFHPLRETDGRISGIFVQGHDVTEVVKADQRQKLMIDELNHRVKNTLATVQSIALQTSRTHMDPRSFAEAFQARILALSHTHNLLTKSHWEGADLGDVIRHEIQAYGPNRLTLDGPAIALEPAMAVSLGMIFHELATNAAKYGALTPGSGHVVVNWDLQEDGTLLNLRWSEREGPQAEPPKRLGFGTRLIERNVRHDLSGRVETYFTPEGFKAEFSIPLSKEEI